MFEIFGLGTSIVKLSWALCVDSDKLYQNSFVIELRAEPQWKGWVNSEIE
jgi:hypothetical protein